MAVIKLLEDGTNWATYRDRMLLHLRAQGLSRHVSGTIRRPPTGMLVKHEGHFFLESSAKSNKSTRSLTDPLEQDAIDQIEDACQTYERNEAIGLEILYNSLPEHLLFQINREPTLSAAWDKLVEIHADRKPLIFETLFCKLVLAKYEPGNKLHDHISRMLELRHNLDGSISDDEFLTRLYNSVSTIPRYGQCSAAEYGQKTWGRPLDLTTLLEELDAWAHREQVEGLMEGSG